MTEKKQRLLYWMVIVLSILFIWGGYQLTGQRANLFRNKQDLEMIPCRVNTILRDNTDIGELGGAYYMERILVFEGTFISGPQKGETVKAYQSLDNVSTVGVPAVEKGDKIFLHKLEKAENGAEWQAGEYLRSNTILLLGAVFMAGLLLFGRKKGFNTIVSLTFTCLAIFVVFVPAILSGYNPYLLSIITCTFVIAMTLPLVSGFNRKTLASALGCAGGVAVAGTLAIAMERILKLTGYLDDNSMYVSLLNEDNPIDLKGIIFAAIIIGAMGATMDVAMSISSSLSEIKEKVPDIAFPQLFSSGLNIGRDIMGTMSNTLILAYIGSSLSTVLLFVSYQSSLTQLLNRETIVVELLQALTGSLGILCTIPISAFVSALLYQRKTTSGITAANSQNEPPQLDIRGDNHD